MNSICSYGQSLEDDIALWRDLGIDHVALILPKLEAAGWAEAQALVSDAGLHVSTIFGPTYRPLDADPALGWRAEDQAGTVQTLEFASEIGAGSVYICTGAATTMTWDQAADAFCEFLAPSVALADSLGVPLLLEPTNPMRIDVSFVFWQRDAMDLARQAGTKVMLDFQSSWYERDLRGVVRDNIDLIHMRSRLRRIGARYPSASTTGPRISSSNTPSYPASTSNASSCSTGMSPSPTATRLPVSKVPSL